MGIQLFLRTDLGSFPANVLFKHVKRLRMPPAKILHTGHRYMSDFVGQRDVNSASRNKRYDSFAIRPIPHNMYYNRQFADH